MEELSISTQAVCFHILETENLNPDVTLVCAFIGETQAINDFIAVQRSQGYIVKEITPFQYYACTNEDRGQMMMERPELIVIQSVVVETQNKLNNELETL